MSEKLETVNARITDTMLGIEDHGCMTFFIHFEWRSCGQGLGGYALDMYNQKTNDRDKGWGPGIVAIRKILEVVGVEKWEDLKGQLVRLKVAGLGSARPPIIGNIIEEKWFDMQEFANQNKKE